MENSVNPTVPAIVAEIELSYRPAIKTSQLVQLVSPKEVYELLLRRWDPGKIAFVEQFKIVLFNHAKRVLGIYELSTGGTTFCMIDIRLIFAAAIKANATEIILAHNHPSGNLKPSQQDLANTRKIQQAGLIMTIPLIDHLIITNEGYFSFANEGLL